METKTQLRHPESSDLQFRMKKNNRIKTLVFYTAICCLFSISLTAQKKDNPDKTGFLNSDTTLSWASRYNNMGMVYIKNKQFKAAYDAFSAYEKRFPDEGMAFRNWAVYYALQNEKEIALMFFQRAVALGYNDVKWLKTDDSMETLKNEKAFAEILKKLEKKG